MRINGKRIWNRKESDRNLTKKLFMINKIVHVSLNKLDRMLIHFHQDICVCVWVQCIVSNLHLIKKKEQRNLLIA